MSVYVVKRPGVRSASLHVVAIIASAVMLTFSGAYDTDNLTVLHRLSLFTVISGLLIGQASMLDGLFRRFFGNGALSLFIAAALTLGLTLALMTFEVHALKFTPLLPKSLDPLFELALFLAPFVLAGAGLVVFFKTPDAAHTIVIEPLEIGYERVLELSAHPVIAGLLPPPAPDAPTDWPPATVERVVAQDHYLELTTADGRMLIRGRMKDALARLGSKNGVQPHRSWWVRADKIKRLERRGRDFVLMLDDGSEAPVARGRIDKIKARLKELYVES